MKYLDFNIKLLTLATLLIFISCKPINSSVDKNSDKKKEKTGTATSNLPDRNYGSKLVYSRDTRSPRDTNFSTSSVEIDSSASTVTVVQVPLETNEVTEIRRMYRITDRLNKTTSARYYQTVFRYTSANAKALILKNTSNARVDTQNQTITSKERDMEGYVFNIRIENISDSTINLRFVEGQEIIDDDVLGGFFTR